MKSTAFKAIPVPPIHHLVARTLPAVRLGPYPSMPFQCAICVKAFCTSMRFSNTFSQHSRSS